MAFRLPNNSIVSGEGYTTINGIQYPLSRMSPQELAAIGVTIDEPAQVIYDSRFYFLSQQGAPVPRAMPDIRTMLKNDVETVSVDIRSRYLKRFGHLVTFVLDKLVDTTVNGVVLTQNQKDNVNDAVVKLRRLTRLNNKQTQVNAEIDALADVTAAQAYVYDLTDPADTNP